MKITLKTSLVIPITAESACTLTAETVDLIFYRYPVMFSIPLALFAGAFTVVAPTVRLKQPEILHFDLILIQIALQPTCL